MQEILAAYNWQAGLVLVVAVVGLTVLGNKLVLMVPTFRQVHERNRAEDAARMAKKKYPPTIKRSNQVGLITNLVFVIFMAPFIIDFEVRPWWRGIADTVLILMVYDFAYYLTHRFLFHAPFDSRFAILRYFRRVHAVHHQARDPSKIDSYYLNPMETFLGQQLFQLSALFLGLALGGFHVASLVVAMLVYINMNLFNHVKFEVPEGRYKILNWISHKHHIHHIDMSKGNYATVSLLYDKLFGTLD